MPLGFRGEKLRNQINSRWAQTLVSWRQVEKYFIEVSIPHERNKGTGLHGWIPVWITQSPYLHKIRLNTVQCFGTHFNGCSIGWILQWWHVKVVGFHITLHSESIFCFVIWTAEHVADVDVHCYLQLESLKDPKRQLLKGVLKSTCIKYVYVSVWAFGKKFVIEFVDVSSVSYVCV